MSDPLITVQYGEGRVSTFRASEARDVFAREAVDGQEVFSLIAPLETRVIHDSDGNVWCLAKPGLWYCSCPITQATT